VRRTGVLKTAAVRRPAFGFCTGRALASPTAEAEGSGGDQRGTPCETARRVRKDHDAKATRRRVRKREVRTLRNIPAPSCNTRTLGPLAKSERPYNPHVLRVGLNGHPPGGGWFVLSRLGEEWGCAKESRRAELARKRRHRGSAFTITNRRNKRLNLSRS